MRTVTLLVVVMAAACVEPPVEEPRFSSQKRTVVARGSSPNAMFLVDASAAMAQPGLGGKQCLHCLTLLDVVKAATVRRLEQSGDRARYGLAVSPSGDGCQAGGAAVEVLEPIDTTTQDRPDPLQARADVIAARVRTLTPRASQMPLAGALASVGALPAFGNRDRHDFVFLFTGGAPGCGTGDPVQAVADLQAKRIRTIVFGIGRGALEPGAAATLDAMATAGGFAATCPQGLDSECGGGLRCMPNYVCERKFFYAEDAARLAWWLERVIEPVVYIGWNPCRVLLEQEVSPPESLVVLVDGNSIEPGPDMWTTDGRAVTFHGSLCERLKNAMPDSPVSLEFRFPLP